MAEQGKVCKRSHISIDLKSFYASVGTPTTDGFPISKRTDPKTPVW